MSDKPSPGPWHTNVDAANCLELRRSDTNEVIAYWYDGQRAMSPEDERLIAAAPEMLALLRRCRHGVEVAIDEGVGEADVLAALDALLARIAGEPPP